MELSSVLNTVQEDLICPICLSYLTDPVTTNCGHNFCDACIQVLWETRQTTLLCPVCRYPHEEKNHFRANPQMERLVDLVKYLHLSRTEETRQEEANMCETHNLALTLFCEDDQELVCLMCSFINPHKNHNVRSVEKAASYHREKLFLYIKALKKQITESKTLLSTVEKNLLELKEQIGKHRNRLTSDFDFLHLLVKRVQMATFSRLEEEDSDFQQKFKINVAEISDYISTVKSLREELAEKSVMSKGNILREVKSIKYRCARLESPSLWSIEFKKEGYSLPPLYSELQNIIQKFQEEVTLDPKTAHPSLCVSEDGKTVNYVRERSKDGGKLRESDDAVVLGSEGYSSGRHYWEVKVGNKTEWAVGVCSDTPSSNEQPPLLGQKRSWTIQLQDGNYLAGGSVPVLVSVKSKPQKIGIYLDYELGQISFYDARDRSHIHSLIETFSDVLKPYFWVGWDSKPLILCEVEIV
ncbi:tripartite motif-containing protein 75-like [Sorex araneus]|uniref:tripartite motif-containing protein 75-like n=1 Tax=Sorex araneus TaxID=42254 RepID=UPI0024336282|nr:tripartite motif-containing protein 75-like [Sorex araneus]